MEKKIKMLKIKGNKKGSLQDLIIIGAVLLFVGVIVLFGYKITSEFNDRVQVQAGMPAEARTAAATLTNHYSGTIDYGFLMLTVGLAIATLILAALVRIHPVFIPLFFIGLVIVIFLCAVFSNIYQEMAADVNLIAQADNLTFVTYILTYLPFIVGIFGFVLMMVMYKLYSVSNE